MPRGIVKVEDRIFVGDYLNGILKVINLTENNVKVIRIGDEPNSMTLCT